MALLANRAHETPYQLAQTAVSMINALDKVRVVPFGSAWGSFTMSALMRIGATEWVDKPQEDLNINTGTYGAHICRPKAADVVHGLDYMYEPAFGGAPGINNTTKEQRVRGVDQVIGPFIYQTVKDEGLYYDSWTDHENYPIGMGVTPCIPNSNLAVRDDEDQNVPATGYSRDVTVFLRGGFFKILWKSDYNWSPLAKFPLGTVIEDAQVEITVDDDAAYPPKMIKTTEKLFYQNSSFPTPYPDSNWWNDWVLMADRDENGAEIAVETEEQTSCEIAIGFLGETPAGDWHFLGSYMDDGGALLRPGLTTVVSFKAAAQHMIDTLRPSTQYKDFYFFVCPVANGITFTQTIDDDDKNKALLVAIAENFAKITGEPNNGVDIGTSVMYHTHYHWPSWAERLEMYHLKFTRVSHQFLLHSLTVGTPVVQFTLPDSALTRPADYGNVPDLTP